MTIMVISTHPAGQPLGLKCSRRVFPSISLKALPRTYGLEGDQTHREEYLPLFLHLVLPSLRNFSFTHSLSMLWEERISSRRSWLWMASSICL
jgi:hypothetical protein